MLTVWGLWIEQWLEERDGDFQWEESWKEQEKWLRAGTVALRLEPVSRQ